MLIKVREWQDVQSDSGSDKVKFHGGSVDSRPGWMSSGKPTDLLAILQGQDADKTQSSLRML